MNLQKCLLKAHSLSVLGNLKKTQIMRLSVKLLESINLTAQDFSNAYGDYLKYILENGSVSEIFYQELLYDENIFAKNARKFPFSALSKPLLDAVGFDS